MTPRTVRRNGHIIGGAAHELETRDISGVEIFAVGTWNGDTYTADDLKQLAENFNELKGQVDPPVKIGHSDDQKFLEREGYPAAGWVDQLHVFGDKLVADLVKVPAKIADLIEASAYRKVSAEIWFDFGKLGGKTYDKVLKAIAFLGEEIPAVSNITDITELYRDAYHTDLVPVASMQYASSRPAHVATYAVEEKAVADPEAETLLEELRKVAEKAKKGSRGKKGAPRFRTWLDEAIASLGRVLKVKENAATDEDSFEDLRAEIQEALDEQYGQSLGGDPIWIVATFPDKVIVRRGFEGDDYWLVPYTDNEETETLELSDPVRVEQTWTPVAGAATLSRSPRRTKRDHLAAHAKAAGIGEEKDEENDMDPKKVAKALGLSEDADEAAILAAIGEQKKPPTEVAELKAEVTKLREERELTVATDSVEQAIKARKLAPAQRDWAIDYARANATGFAKYVEKATPIFGNPNGSENDAPEAQGASELHRLASEKAAADKIPYAQALRAVSADHPELAEAYEADAARAN